MFDLNWLSTQAREIHGTFTGIFYLLVGLFIVVGVVCDYFKLALGAYPDSVSLIGRAFVAALLLYAYPEISNTIADVTDAIAQRIGSLNQFQLVLSKMGDKLKELTWSWISIKDSLILLFSFLTFFILYITVYLANAGIVYVSILLYIFSPILISLFVLPATASATKAMFRALIEVCAWKIVWAVLAALLWSSALGHMNQSGSSLSFLTVIAYNLILAISLVLTPFVVNALISKGLAQTTSGWLGLAAGAAALSPGVVAKGMALKTARRAVKTSAVAYKAFKSNFSGKQEGVLGAPQQTKMPKVPAWFKTIPPPHEPPGWLQAKIDRENQQQKRRKK